MRKLLLLIAILLLSVFPSMAVTVFVSQNGGSVTCGTLGTQTTQTLAWFNSTTPVNISGGNTYTFCNAIDFTAATGSNQPGVTAITLPTSGTAGNLITVDLSQADLKNDYWPSSGAVKISGKSFILVDGNNSVACSYTSPFVQPLSNGSCSGIIENTTNGTPNNVCDSGWVGFANQQGNSIGVDIAASSHDIEVRNIYFKNGYKNDGSFGCAVDDAAGRSGTTGVTAIFVSGNCSNCLLHNNTIGSWSVGVVNALGTGSETNFHFYNNYIYDVHWGGNIGANTGNPSMSNVDQHDNWVQNQDLVGVNNWQCPATARYCGTSTGVGINVGTYSAAINYVANQSVTSGGTPYMCVQANGPGSLVVTPGTNTAYWVRILDTYHTDGFINWGYNNQLIPVAIDVYNNYFPTDLGQGSATAPIAMTYAAGASPTTNGAITGNVYNNVIKLINHHGGAMTMGGFSKQLQYFNNFIDCQWFDTVATNGGPIGLQASGLAGGANHVFTNNVIQNCQQAVLGFQGAAATFATYDNNDYFNIEGTLVSKIIVGFSDGNFSTLAALQAAYGNAFEQHGKAVDPAVNSSTYKINVGSGLIGAAINESSLGISGAASDIYGLGRPLLGAGSWDIGPTVFVAAAGPYPVTLAALGNANGKVCTDGTTCTDGILNAVMTAGVTTGTSTHSFTAGATATLTATATTGQFVTFSGGGCTTSPCTITVNSPLTITATFQTMPTCSLSFASNSVNSPGLASATTVFTQLSGPNTLWFIFGPPPDNALIYNCSFPYSNCNANGQTGNIIPVGSGQYTGAACANGLCCTGSTAPLNNNTGAGSAAH